MSSKIWRQYSDYIVVVCIGLVLLSGGLATLLYINRPMHIPNNIPYHNYPPDNDALQQTTPPDKQFPPFAKTQRSFYRTYTAGDIQYNIEKLNVNASHDPALGTDSFAVSLYNYQNKAVTPTGDDLKGISVGCVAQDGPYRKIDVPVTPLTFGAYETKKVVVETDATCVYLGDAGGQWFWKVY